jgi:capsid portal protein
MKRAGGKPELGAFQGRLEEKNTDPLLQVRAAEIKATGKSQQPDIEDAYEAYNCIKPPFSYGVMTSLLDLDPYLAGAVEAIATNVSACDCEIAWTGEGDDGPKEQRKELETFFLKSNDPTNPMSLQEKMRVSAVDYVALGSWNLEIVQGGGRMMDLVHAPAEYIRVTKGMESYLMVKNGTKAPFTLYGDPKRDKAVNQILRAIRKRPGHRVYGKPAIFPLMNTVLLNALRDEKNLTWFDQGLLSDLLVLLEENITEEVRTQIEADYQNSGDGSQTLFLLHGCGKGLIHELKRSLEDESITKMEGNNRQRVLSVLRTPPAKVGIYEDANRANSITQDETFRAEVIKPIQDTFRVRFNHVIQYGFGFKYWEFRVKPYALRDRKEEAEIDEIYIDKGVFSVNDILAKLNLPPVEGGERRVVNTPLGLVDLNTWTIAVADPKADPAQAARLVTRLAELRKELQGRTGHTCEN